MKLNFTMLAIAIVSMLLVTSCNKDDNQVALTGITLDKTTTSIAIGVTETLTVVYTPVDANNKELSWTSSNESIATVADGVVTGVAVGETTITAVSKTDETIIATCAVNVVYAAGTTFTISGNITADETWHKDFKYKLSGYVYVKNNATLTIESGTIIQGISGTKAALIIERGSKIMAQGTATAPIVFTSDKPKGQRATGDWGGLVLLGRARTNKHDSGTGVGVAEGGIGSEYGGVEDNDNTGVLQYVRIEYAGIALTDIANSEINGLTLYAVGKATTIDHIQVSYSGDDSYEFFGGAVNCRYLVAYAGIDDDFDTDNGYSGTVQFGLAFRNPDFSDVVSKSNGFESDNDAAGSLLEPITSPTFCNMSVFGPLASAATFPATHYFQSAMHLRRSTRTSVYNSVFVGWPEGLRIDGGLGNSPAQADANVLQIENTILAGIYNNNNYPNVSAGYTSAQTQAYFESISPARNNALASLTDAIGANLLSLTTPTFLPANGNMLLSGASFANTRLSDNTFITPVTYRGAFGTTDWTAGWCNFDPQNTNY